MPNILVVEDDENLNRGITFSLKKSGYEVFSAESVKKAKRIASDNNVDVAICDVNLPDGNGLELVRWMRNCQNVYIICLTALDQETDQVMGYEAGADDYMTKPFSLSVLLLKIEAHFRRRKNEPGTPKIHSKDIVFIPGEMRAFVKEREISLTKNELKMLSFFFKTRNRFFQKYKYWKTCLIWKGILWMKIQSLSISEDSVRKSKTIRRLRSILKTSAGLGIYGIRR